MKKHISAFQKKLIALIILSAFAISFAMPGLAAQSAGKVLPKRIALPLPDVSEMVVGDSRVVEVLFYSGNDILDKNFKNVTERQVTWTITPAACATIDSYGRLETIATGKIKLTVTSVANPKASDSKYINIVSAPTMSAVKPTVAAQYSGPAAATVANLQKTVDRFDAKIVPNNPNIPKEVRVVARSKTANHNPVVQGTVSWNITKFADGSNAFYVNRIDSSLKEGQPDRIQYFMGDRYIPGDGKSPIAIFDDKQQGIWVVDATGSVNHINMKPLSYEQKALLMSSTSDKYVNRMGSYAGAHWNGKSWDKEISDNDGLWTSMYGGGELMRYSVTKADPKASAQEIAAARASALRSLKTVLLIANISGRDGDVDARIRHLNNIRIGNGNRNSQEYLKPGAVFAIDNYVGSPNDHIGFTGLNAGKENDDHFCGGTYYYSLGAINPNDWTTSGPGATTKRSLKGFIARTFSIPAVEPTPFDDGTFFQRNSDGTTTVVSQADRLDDYAATEHPHLNIGNIPLPDVLKDVLVYNGKQYDVTDVAYKGDTSTDEIIGHLFMYKIAWDILNDNDKEEHALKELIRTTISNYSQHLIDNGYGLMDASGQGTKWGKTTRDYFNSDFTVEDNSLNSLVMLDTFKLAYYITGEKKWQDEYLLLANNPAYNYAALTGEYWNRWMWLVENEDYASENGLLRLDASKKPSLVEKERHAFYSLNHSDEEMAMMAFYVIFQLETDNTLRNKYRAGLEGWWHSVSYSQNPLWYYIYQTANPTKTNLRDGYGNNLLQNASWALSRHPIDTIRWQAFIDGARPDVLLDNGISINPNSVVGKRTSLSDSKLAASTTNTSIDSRYDPMNIYQIIAVPADERSVHKFNGTNFTDSNSHDADTMEPATTYTLPYWFGRYHNMLAE